MRAIDDGAVGVAREMLGQRRRAIARSGSKARWALPTAVQCSGSVCPIGGMIRTARSSGSAASSGTTPSRRMIATKVLSRHCVRDVGQDRARLPHQSHVIDIAAPEMQALDPEAIVLGRLVLLDIAARFERGEQAKDVVLMQLETLGKFGDAEFIDFAEKLFEHVERMRNRLDNVVCFIAPEPWTAILLERRRDGATNRVRFWKNVLI